MPILELAGEPSADRSRCGAVPILEFRRRGEGGGGERGEEGGGGGREQGGGRRREEGEEQAADAPGDGLLGKYQASSGAKLLLLQIAPVRFRLGVGVAGELERGVREDGVDPQGRRGRSALIIGGVTLVRTRDSKLPLALTAACRPALG